MVFVLIGKCIVVFTRYRVGLGFFRGVIVDFKVVGDFCIEVALVLF